MDIDGFPLAAISERSTIDNDTLSSTKYNKRAPIHPANSNASMENGTKFNQSITFKPSNYSDQSVESPSRNSEQIKKYNQYEVNSVADDDDRTESQRPSQLITDRDSTMLSSYTTGGGGAGDNDVIEIHQFSSADIDAYLDIYFETLDSRLRHYIGQDEQLQQFRIEMKNRINSNPNAREYQNVLLGKMNGDILAAVKILFPGETSTISPTSNPPQQSSCLSSIRRWITQKANYIPTNIEECYIEMIGVKTAYRNHGIGSAMLECVEHVARQSGARLLTIHTHGQQLRNYFQRYGFNIDHNDSSSFWKWMLERQTINKLSKPLSSDEELNDYAMGSYINESMVGSIEE